MTFSREPRTLIRSIGRFSVQRRLGSGAQGTVYLCLDPELQRQVAIKLLERPFYESGLEEQGFVREARAISRIQHPNIVSIYDTGRVDNRPYLVFEYVAGKLLSDHLGSGKPPIADALNIMEAILDGVAQVHREGIVHRDLKPANIILNAESVPKIMDFGLARIHTKAGGADAIRTGTPRYMAPEYIARGEVSPQADLFSLGAILYEMVTGHHAFAGKSQQEVFSRILKSRVKQPSRINGKINHKLEAIILKALEKNPIARYTSAQEMLQALQEYRHQGEQAPVEVAVSDGTVEFLLRRMQHQSDFPVLSESIRRLNQLAESEDQDVNQLASILIRDFALTSKILRIVNSAYYSRFAGKIGTISRAIVVLGINTIRSIAASLVFFEHLSNKGQAERLKDLVGSAVFSATLARQAAEDAKLENVEEGFLCGLLHHLGKVLVAYYLDSESEEIERLVHEKQLDQAQAELRVLGISYEELGIAVARQWNFPGIIIQGMTRVDPGHPGNLKKTDVKLRLIANFSNEAAALLGADTEDLSPFKGLLKRYRMGLAISEKRFARMVEDARTEFSQLGTLEQNRHSPFMKRLVTKEVMHQPVEKPEETQADITQTLALESGDEAIAIVTDTGVSASINPEAVLTEGLQEISAMLLDEQINLNQLLNVVLETIYRAVGFSRVLLCLQDLNKENYVARMGFGEDIESFIPQFHFPRRYSTEVFHAALKNDLDLYIADSRDPRIARDIPDWYKRISNAGSFAIFPLVIKHKPIGLIYADHERKQGVMLEGKRLGLIKALRNQVILALKTRM